ncbi:Eukaryotic translation initiation factor 3 subunit F [Cichlidogyrus casuarinus]|uniref:Eukaryotic translation initiation factor 3 subunit F n=1 Tax=Cichlidogyrus casuarinus TaxID=1844966 RepID=A0ABD2PXZ2_9PLAT
MESTIGVRIHPVVLLSIADAYERRQNDSDRVIGTLLGSFSMDKGVVQVTNCFAIPYSIVDKDVQFNAEFSSAMLKLERDVNKTVQPVGWYATGCDISEDCLMIHKNFYMKNFQNPVFLLVDTNLSPSNKISLKVYQKRDLGVPGSTNGSVFLSVNVVVESFELERIAVEMMASKATSNPLLRPPAAGSDLEYLYETSERLLKLLDQVVAYVQSVVDGEREPDNVLGRAITQLIFSIPKLDPEQTDALINSSFKDLLMITYLTNLIRTHLKFLNLSG